MHPTLAENYLYMLFCIGKYIDEYSEKGHPYVHDFMLTSDLMWVVCMSPLIFYLLSEANFWKQMSHLKHQLNLSMQ